jgi:hypothetical protein
MANWPDTVTVSSEAVLEAVSALRAVDEFFMVLNGRSDSRVGAHVLDLAGDLKNEAFGDEPEGDEEYERDPLIVEVKARESEKCAELLRVLQQTRELTVPLSANDLWPEELDERKHAQDIREAGALVSFRAVS